MPAPNPIMVDVSKRLVIVAYDPRWPQVYEQEKAAIVSAIGSRLVAIEHVGSTAVPNLGAKPIIDVMAGLPSLADAEGCIVPVEALGYHFVPEVMRDLPDDRYFERWTESYEHGREVAHLHLTEHKSPFWNDHLLFRDLLRARPETASAYEQLKRDLVQRTSGAGYVHAKTSFVQSVLAQARMCLVASRGEAACTHPDD